MTTVILNCTTGQLQPGDVVLMQGGADGTSGGSTLIEHVVSTRREPNYMVTLTLENTLTGAQRAVTLTPSMGAGWDIIAGAKVDAVTSGRVALYTNANLRIAHWPRGVVVGAVASEVGEKLAS